MKILLNLLLILVLITGCSRNKVSTTSKWVDLTHDFSSETIYWPTGEPFKLTEEFEGKTEKGYYYSAFRYSASEHGGTHLDAPIHFASGGKTVDQVPLNMLIGKGVLIDVSKKVIDNKDYLINIEDISEWESKHGDIPDDAILLFYTGYSQYWPDRVKYLGTAKKGKEGVNELHFPGLSPMAAEWIIKNHKIKAIGLDTASIDYGQSKNFECHQILLGNDILIFENVANLDKLPARDFKVIALPMKIKDGSGAPLRIVAEIN